MFEREAQRFQGDTKKIIERITDNNVDRELMLSDEVFEILNACYEQSIKDDFSHLGNEIVIHSQSWGFCFSDIQCPVDIWNGNEDMYTPRSLTERTLAKLKNGQFHRLMDKGHFLYYELWPEILNMAMCRIQQSQGK